MNEQANKDLVKKLYDAFSRGDIQMILDHVTDDTVWTMCGPAATLPQAGCHIGRAGVGQFFQSLADTQTDMKLVTNEYIAEGDRVVTIGTYAATVKTTGERAETPAVHVFRIRDGRIAAFDDYLDTAAWVEAYTGAGQSAAASR